MRSTSCVLLDLNLPDADGMAALEAIRDAAPSVPVVVLTGQQGRVAGVAALNAGAQDYLEKNELSSARCGGRSASPSNASRAPSVIWHCSVLRYAATRTVG